MADYIGENDRVWLQSNRIELNAMTTPEFIEWLDCKFRPYAGKLIPPIEVMEHRLRQTTRRKLSQKLTEDILRDAESNVRSRKRSAGGKMPLPRRP